MTFKILKKLEDDMLKEVSKKGSKGARMIKVDNSNIVFMTQVESYVNRGVHFAN